MKNIDAIIVTFYPIREVIEKTIETIEKQVRNIIIVDNTPEEEGLDYLKIQSNIEIVYLKENKGIAFAQNLGISISLENNSDLILLSDQDTSYPDNYVKDMVSVIGNNNNVAAIGPLFKDLNQKKQNEGFVKKRKFLFEKIFPNEGLYELRHIIASGEIINTKILNKIGLFNEALFIDWVDLEWCWRANFLGYKILGNADVLIWHNLGDSSIDIGIREVSLRSYIRNYYITRNSFYLSLRCNYLNIILRCILFFKSFRYIVGYTVLSKEHIKNLKYTLRGMFDGLIGNQGPIDKTYKEKYKMIKDINNE